MILFPFAIIHFLTQIKQVTSKMELHFTPFAMYHFSIAILVCYKNTVLLDFKTLLGNI